MVKMTLPSKPKYFDVILNETFVYDQNVEEVNKD